MLPEQTLQIAQAIEREPDREEPHIGRSECWLRLGRPEEALASADAAIKIYKVYETDHRLREYELLLGSIWIVLFNLIRF